MSKNQRIQEYRNKRIREIANFIAADFFNNHHTDLDRLLSEEGIQVIYDHYESCFDGLTVFDSNEFFFHLNIDKGNQKGSKRSRFSIAHEFGHYFIPEHHQSIVDGTFKCHPSNFNTHQSNIIEQEADIFAASLLMPSNRFKDACYRTPFSLKLIEELSESFYVSRLSVLQRFIDVDAGTYPLMISFYRNGLLSGFKQSEDFPYKNIPFKSKMNHPPPPTSAMGEYYSKKDAKFTDVQTVYTDDWFWVDYTKKLNEQCFYSDYGYDISILWPD